MEARLDLEINAIVLRVYWEKGDPNVEEALKQYLYTLGIEYLPAIRRLPARGRKYYAIHNGSASRVRIIDPLPVLTEPAIAEARKLASDLDAELHIDPRLLSTSQVELLFDDER